MITKIRNYFLNKKAAKEFEKHWQGLMAEAERNERAAIFEIGMLYENGVGVDKDMERASEFYLRAAELGMKEAQRKVAGWYERGENFERDLVKALIWYKKCTETNNFDDALNFARLCAHPEIEVEAVRDYLPKAIGILNDAVSAGDVDAMCQLGSLQIRGMAPKSSVEDGYQLLKIAAFKGQTDAQIYLGDACVSGTGTAKDMVEAIRWYEVAMKNGHPLAKERIEEWQRLTEFTQGLKG